jgi:hypothetical protein
MKISIVINLDTRPQNDSFGGNNLTGVVNSDFLVDGVINKMKFFTGLDKEIIVHIDKHHEISDEVLSKLHDFCDILLIRKHTHEYAFNDWNYYRALSLATGDVVCHVDQDTACFTSGEDYVHDLVSNLNDFKFVSYPSHWTPYPVYDETFGGKFWASTRFFLCKRESLQLDELAKCIENPEWMYEKYGDSQRRCNWTEHFLTKINGNSVYYPPVELHKGAIFSWSSYKTGTLEMLNNLPYEAVKQWVIHRGGIQYPVDVKCD